MRLIAKETGREGIMRAVMDLLTAERLLFFRMNSGDRIGSYTSKRTGRTKAWRIKGHAAGTADILFFIPEQVVWCEVKAPGKVQTDEQRDFQREVEEQGHSYLLVRSSDDLLEWLKEHGIAQ